MKEITPKHLRCIPASCPAVYKRGKDLVIIGKIAPQVTEELGDKIGPDEAAIVISPEYFADLEK